VLEHAQHPPDIIGRSYTELVSHQEKARDDILKIFPVVPVIRRPINILESKKLEGQRQIIRI
jgi:hypothetical protein